MKIKKYQMNRIKILSQIYLFLKQVSIKLITKKEKRLVIKKTVKKLNLFTLLIILEIFFPKKKGKIINIYLYLENIY